MDEVGRQGFVWLRRSIGGFGMLLPFAVTSVCYLGDETCTAQSSISAYYHTDVRWLFVGVLIAIAVLLWSYPGYDREDDLAGNLAAIFALGVALFPTHAGESPSGRERVLSVLHYASAIGMFSMLAVFCIVLFRRTANDRNAVRARSRNGTLATHLVGMLRRVDPGPNLSATKDKRNQLFLWCGRVIIFRMLGILVVGPTGFLAHMRPVLVLETIALVAFGAAWSAKGDMLFLDPPESSQPSAPETPARATAVDS